MTSPLVIFGFGKRILARLETSRDLLRDSLTTPSPESASIDSSCAMILLIAAAVGLVVGMPGMSFRRRSGSTGECERSHPAEGRDPLTTPRWCYPNPLESTSRMCVH